MTRITHLQLWHTTHTNTHTCLQLYTGVHVLQVTVTAVYIKHASNISVLVVYHFLPLLRLWMHTLQSLDPFQFIAPQCNIATVKLNLQLCAKVQYMQLPADLQQHIETLSAHHPVTDIGKVHFFFIAELATNMDNDITMKLSLK